MQLKCNDKNVSDLTNVKYMAVINMFEAESVGTFFYI